MAAETEAPNEIPPAEAVNAGAASSKKQLVDPWNVSGEVGEDGKTKAIDYTKLVEDFGTKLITSELLERFEKVTGHRPHRFLRRKIFFSERDLTTILDRHEKVRICWSFHGIRLTWGLTWDTGRALLPLHGQRSQQ
jgi:tryptophanyl-tRNA synthetase